MGGGLTSAGEAASGDGSRSPATASYIALGGNTGLEQWRNPAKNSQNKSQHVAAGRTQAVRSRPLRGLVPFLRPYRWHIAGAAFALVMFVDRDAVVPAAARR